MTITIILLMACITFSSRYLMLHPKLPIVIKGKMVTFLSFSAPAVLTAIWAPIIFLEKESSLTSLSNPYFIAGILAIGVAYRTKSVYATLLISGVTFYLLTQFITP
ncbi:branched-chain amino acid ABC transporter [Thalassotalea marina]|uniref:Branched-chain amino acid ABC transporter n=2 Tax=Thalassotalea marina TaxID=1673741 RepID=A0A919BPA4_9GAMM|nr:AzlD domain-containing protein [Thalassotalea marina]GHG02596.1 branched-chain amino acid ABC transporter [Thalassotalea marina]